MLSEKQMEKLKKHAKEHKMTMSSKHMRTMKKLMEEGMSFSKAHSEAMKEEGKRPKSKSNGGKSMKKNKSKY